MIYSDGHLRERERPALGRFVICRQLSVHATPWLQNTSLPCVYTGCALSVIVHQDMPHAKDSFYFLLITLRLIIHISLCTHMFKRLFE